MPLRIAASLAAAALSLGALEAGVRIHERFSQSAVPAASAQELVAQLPAARIDGGEIGRQLIVHNTALFARHPSPGDVTTLYVGTSRSKVLRPGWFGIPNAVNASGNSYSEVSYGLLMQAEAARVQFPHVRTVYVEASLLLRRPAHLRLEVDHRKYLPLLDALMPLRDQLPGADEFRRELASARAAAGAGRRPHFIAARPNLRLAHLLGFGSAQSVPVLEDKWIASLRDNGERIDGPGPALTKSDQRPEIRQDSVKVQRLREIKDWKPWDGLFDMFALWGRHHRIQVVFFQPPVRSDAYRWQVEYGLEDHVADMQRVAAQYGVPFIDLDRPGLGYLEDWSLFSDEDHMETCPGVVLLQSALEEGSRRFRAGQGTTIAIPRAELESTYAAKLKQCPLRNGARG